MNEHARIRIYGDRATHRFHTFQGVDERLTAILSQALPGISAGDIACREDYDALRTGDLARCELLVWYIDAWATRGSNEVAAALLSYVANGGRLLTLHGGIITHESPELEAMHGGAFTGHPPQCELAYAPIAGHAMTEGVDAFAMVEEPYRLETTKEARDGVFLTYAHEGQVYPAAWARSFALGRIAYLSIGHTPESFDVPQVARLVGNMARALMAG